jgi:hypothetical protein
VYKEKLLVLLFIDKEPIYFVSFSPIFPKKFYISLKFIWSPEKYIYFDREFEDLYSSTYQGLSFH